MKTIKIPCPGYEVVADWYETDDTKNIILFLIGWTSNRAKYKPLIEALQAITGYSALVFDYSGHGDSPFDIGETRPAQQFLEVICVFDQLKARHPDAAISIVGTNYGGFLATQLTKYRQFDKLALRVPAIYKPSDFYTLNKDIDREWTNKVFRKDVEALAKHPLLARASSFKGRTLVVVHENDELVPKETTDAFIKAFGAETYLAKGFTHDFDPVSKSPEQIKEYQAAIGHFLAAH